jgi:CHASE3 domain sensor protein
MPIKATRTLILSQPAVSLALTIALVLISSAVLLSVLSTRGLNAASQRFTHTQLTLVTASQLLATIAEAETGQRGFLLTGDLKYLAPYEAARARLPGELALLRRQYAGGQSDQTVLLDRLQVLVDGKLQELAHTLALLREAGIAPALDLVGSDEGWRLMNEIRQLLQSIQTREFGELERQSTAATQRAQDFQLLNLGLVSLAVILAGAEAWLLIRRVHELEGLITVCAWTRQVEWQGRWFTFEEYFNRRFNLRFTHGICEEAAKKMRADAKTLPAPEVLKQP